MLEIAFQCNTPNSQSVAISDISEIENEERILLRKLCLIKYVLYDTILNYHTHLVAQLAVDIATSFHHYYAKHVIIDQRNIARSRHRLVIVICVEDVLTLLFDLLCVSVPERM